MEVAGLVLAVYPVIIMTFEQYKKGSRYFSHWIQFRRRYESFIRDMEGQQLFFEGILQDLLCGGPNPYLIGGDSKDSFLDIVSDKDFTGWRDPVLKQRLVTRLDSRYDWCMYTIKRIYDIMTGLGELLDIQAVSGTLFIPVFRRTCDRWTALLYIFNKISSLHNRANLFFEKIFQPNIESRGPMSHLANVN
jgi:hypothetical protein